VSIWKLTSPRMLPFVDLPANVTCWIPGKSYRKGPLPRDYFAWFLHQSFQIALQIPDHYIAWMCYEWDGLAWDRVRRKTRMDEGST